MAIQKIQFFKEVNTHNILFSKTAFRTVAEKIFQDYNKTLHFINIVFCNDEQILEVNKTHLNHDYYTDIITFDYNHDLVESDIFISTDRVKDNASQLGIKPTIELYRVLIHGCLHLCGLKDKTQKESTIMRSMENHYLQLIP
ncbi:MAG: rRNA maturation RNase YbeY [Saprospiraceae bacterium]|jgi:probable rRNA maturation factor|nr:rRNA maturation RNase YbeY [Saprospiraceae bacterium]MCA0333412.1 rRNA maturation RNase YbeY [Bacteroidota bacterium]MCB0605125.1 rRNA maturation RNase YbeY [Saprospiraceae bacterium]MCO5277554.1 rRNA maturation RNase YbeY [Saprospiraceae bacterium]HQU95183.1 rRNA maturation RNase YbeY [Saprospiraceae bacterium]